MSHEECGAGDIVYDGIQEGVIDVDRGMTAGHDSVFRDFNGGGYRCFCAIFIDFYECVVEDAADIGGAMLLFGADD